jgi:hypothetical protein
VNRCKEKVWPDGSRFGHQCSRRATCGDYCKQHAPETVEYRRAEREARWDRQAKDMRSRISARNEHDRRAAMFPEMLDAMRFTLSAMRSNMIVETSERLAEERLVALIAKAEGGAA